MTTQCYAVTIMTQLKFDSYLNYMDALTAVTQDTPMPIFIGDYIPVGTTPEAIESVFGDRIIAIMPYLEDFTMELNDLITQRKKATAWARFLAERDRFRTHHFMSPLAGLNLLKRGHLLTLPTHILPLIPQLLA